MKLTNTTELEKRISTTNEAGLIAILFERLIENFNKCILAIKDKEYNKIHEINNNSRDILAELLFQFSGTDEISSSLREINIYINKIITEGEYQQDPSIFETCIKVITPICEGFQELEIREKPKVVTGLTYGKSYLGEHTLKGNRSFKG
jgi:flagellar protein FliS